MDGQVNEGMIKYDLIFTYGKKIIATLLTEFIYPQTTSDLFSEESIKHHLFHCTFLYSKSNRCHNYVCEQKKQKPHVKSLNKNEFKKMYEKNNDCLCTCLECIFSWKTRENINIEKLDFDTYKRLFECPCFRKKPHFTELDTKSFKIISFRNNVSHPQQSEDFTIDTLLCAANAVKDERKKGRLIEEINNRLKELGRSITTEIDISTSNLYRREEFLKTLLLELDVSEEKKKIFARNNLKFFFEGNITTTFDKSLINSILQKTKVLNIAEKNWLLHTLCYFGVYCILEKVLDDQGLELDNVINNTDYKSQNCLMNACEQEEWDTAKMLLKRFGKRFNLHQKNSDGKTAFSLCANNKEMVKFFIDKTLDTKELFEGISVSFVYNNTLPTFVRSINNSSWKECCYKHENDSYMYTLYLNWNTYGELKEYIEIKPNSEVLRGRTNEESVAGISKVTFKDPDTTIYSGLQIHQEFQPLLFCVCKKEIDHVQEYVLKNKSKDGVKETIGTIEKKDGILGITFQHQEDILALELFCVIKRPIRRQYMLRPGFENNIIFECCGIAYFPGDCLTEPETVYAWIKKGTNMIFINSEKHIKLRNRVKFTFWGKFPDDLEAKAIKVSNMESKDVEITIYEKDVIQKDQNGQLTFAVNELCGKCIVFCESEYKTENVENLKIEIKLLYLGYKKCIIWFGIEEVIRNTTTAWVVLLFNDENILDFLRMKSLNLLTYGKKDNLLIRDFCTFAFQCIGAFKCDNKQFLQVQFCSRTNLINFKIQIKDTGMNGGIEAEGSQDVEKFTIDIPLNRKTSKAQKEEEFAPCSTSKHIMEMPLEDEGAEQILLDQLQICTYCAKHPDHHVKCYCEDDRDFCCEVCVSHSHSKCKNIKYFKDNYAKFIREMDIQDVKEWINKVHKMIEEGTTSINQTEQEAKGYLSNVEKIITAQEKKGKVLTDIQKEVNSEKVKVISALSDRIAVLRKLLETLHDCLRILENVQLSPSSSIVARHKLFSFAEVQFDASRTVLLQDIPELKMSIQEHKLFNIVSRTRFDVSIKYKKPEVSEYFSLCNDILKRLFLHLFNKPMTRIGRDPYPLITCDISFVASADRSNIQAGGWILDGTYLPDNTILLSDTDNKQLIKLDENLGFLEKLPVAGEPHAVCVSSDGNHVHVVCDSNKVVSYTLQGPWREVYRFGTEDGAVGIACHGDRIVTGHDDYVVIYDSTGTEGPWKEVHRFGTERDARGIACHGDRIVTGHGYVGIYDITETEGPWKEVHRFGTERDARGIACHGDRIVTGHDDYVVIYDITGTELSRINMTAWPQYPALSQDGRMLYHGDGHDVVCRSMEDMTQEVWRYSSQKLWMPLGIDTDRGGNILIVGGGSRNVHQVSGDGKINRILVNEMKYMKWPFGLFTNRNNNTFCVTSWGDKVCVEMYTFDD